MSTKKYGLHAEDDSWYILKCDESENSYYVCCNGSEYDLIGFFDPNNESTKENSLAKFMYGVGMLTDDLKNASLEDKDFPIRHVSYLDSLEDLIGNCTLMNESGKTILARYKTTSPISEIIEFK
tara:strand:+ start:189 stop:560 length:372 start_codon:yes stop_codon:yes gene_type:complete